MVGPGKYDQEAGVARMFCGARGVLLIVLGGFKGDGYSAKLTAKDAAALPEGLRKLADQIEADARLLRKFENRPATGGLRGDGPD